MPVITQLLIMHSAPTAGETQISQFFFTVHLRCSDVATVFLIFFHKLLVTSVWNWLGRNSNCIELRASESHIWELAEVILSVSPRG